MLYQNPSAQANSASTKPTDPSQHNHSYPSPPVQTGTGQNSASFKPSIKPPRHPEAIRTPSIPPEPEKYHSLASAANVATSDTDLLLGMNAPYSNPIPRTSCGHPSSTFNQNLPTSGIGTETPAFHYGMPSDGRQAGGSHLGPRAAEYNSGIGSNASDVLIESQNIDMNMLQHPDHLLFGFNGDSIPWLEYLPTDVASLFGEHQHYSSS